MGYLRNFLTRWVETDPEPTYSTLDQMDMMTAQQYLRLDDQTYPYSGEWPPPQRIATVSVDGGVVGLATEEVASTYEGERGFTVQWFTRTRASHLPDEDVQTGSHLARGAEYVREVA